MVGEADRNDRLAQRASNTDTPAPGELGPRANNPAMQYRQMLAQRFGGAQPMQQPMPQPTQQPTAPGGKGNNALTMDPQRPEPQITPAMRQAALQQFESQQGAGQVPYYMAAARRQPMPMPPSDDISYRQGRSRDNFVGGPAPMPRPMPQNPNMSPAFQYAAQNYDILGGSQRLAPRPMEMMSVAERGQINDMSQAMAEQQAQTEFEQMRDLFQRGGAGKGARNAMQGQMQNPGTAPTMPSNTMGQGIRALTGLMGRR